jgi:hypothetical protein
MATPSQAQLISCLRRTVPLALVGLCLYWFFPAWIWHIRRTLDPFAFNDDARVLIWPFLREADPTLFPADPFVGYYLAGLPEGFLALYRCVGRVGWTKVTSEVLPYLSVLSVLLLLSESARRLGGVVAAFLAAVLVLGCASFFERAGGGLPRTFAFPLVSAGLYALVTARPILLALLTIGGAAFYPVVAALLGLSLLLLLVLPKQLRTNPPDWANRQVKTGDSSLTSWHSRACLLLGTFVCVVALLAPMTLRLRAYGDAITPAMLPDFPEAGPSGRLTRDQVPPYENFAIVSARHARQALLGTGQPIAGRAATLLRGSDQRTNLILASIVAAAIINAIACGRKRPEFVRASIPLFAAMLGHLLATLFAPHLFIPERYAQFGVPPVIVLLVAAGFGDFGRHEQRRKRVLHASAAVLTLSILGGRGTSWIGVEVYVPPQERPLYAAISRLPTNVVIAGWPAGPVENIPYLSERRVLTNFQLEMPFHAQFTLQSRARLSAFFEAYFAVTDGPMKRLCSEFHVTHVLVDPKHFDSPPPSYYAPHRSELARLVVAAKGKANLLSLLLTDSTTIHFGSGTSLVDLSKFSQLAPACSGGRIP